jgi:hypothetical protein
VYITAWNATGQRGPTNTAQIVLTELTKSNFGMAGWLTRTEDVLSRQRNIGTVAWVFHSSLHITGTGMHSQRTQSLQLQYCVNSAQVFKEAEYTRQVVRRPPAKFGDSPHYSESELRWGAVTVSFSKYLPWQATPFLQRSTHFSKTCCRPFAAIFRTV